MLALFVENEIRRSLRSYRVHVLTAAFCFQGVADPLGAKFLPRLGVLLGISSEDLPQIRPVQALQSYGSDSTRLVLLVFTIVAMTAAADEFRRGSDSGAFLFTRGADPRRLLDAKILVWAAAATFCSLVGLAVAVATTFVAVGTPPPRGVAYMALGTVVFWPLAAVVVVASAVASRTSWGGFAAGVGLIATGVLELAGILGEWMPTGLLTLGEKASDAASNGLLLTGRPAFAMLSIAVPAYLLARSNVSAPGWD